MMPVMFYEKEPCLIEQVWWGGRVCLCGPMLSFGAQSQEIFFREHSDGESLQGALRCYADLLSPNLKITKPMEQDIRWTSGQLRRWIHRIRKEISGRVALGMKWADHVTVDWAPLQSQLGWWMWWKLGICHTTDPRIRLLHDYAYWCQRH